MKKKELMAFTLLAATMLLIAAGCKKEDGAMAENTVSFSVSVAGQGESKAVLYNNNAALEALGTFKCSAYNTTKNVPVFSGETVTFANSKWSTQETYNWQPGEEMTFCAYAPTDATGVTLPTDGSGIDFSCSVADNASAQTDVMLGYYSGDGNYTGTANITFQHPFTAVRFKMGDLASFIPGFEGITRIQIANVHDGGTLAKWSGGDAFSWTPSSTYKVVSMDISGSFESGQDIVGTDGNAKAFTLVPQDLSTKAATIIIYYDATVDGSIVATVSSVSGGSTSWEARKVYTYTVNFRTLSLSIGGSVDEWTTEAIPTALEATDNNE